MVKISFSEFIKIKIKILSNQIYQTLFLIINNKIILFSQKNPVIKDMTYNIIFLIKENLDQPPLQSQRLGVCRKPTDSPNPTQPKPICLVGSVFKAWWIRLGYKFFIYSGLGWVWVIKLQTRQTRPDPPIFNIYFKYILNMGGSVGQVGFGGFVIL